MKLFELLRLGTQELINRALKGELQAGDLWTAVKGAEKYRRALATGDIAPPNEAASRADICANCPSRKLHRIDAIDSDTGYCGEPFRDQTQSRPPTCGCMVTLTVGGKLTAAGKVTVASESCPQGRWLAVSRQTPDDSVGEEKPAEPPKEQ